jgi:hypothetical protein
VKQSPPESVPFESLSEPLMPQWEPVHEVELSPRPDYPRPHIRVDRSQPIEWKGQFFRAVFTPNSAGARLRWFGRHETQPAEQRHWRRRYWEQPIFWCGSSEDGFYYIGFFVEGKDEALQALETGNTEPFFQLAAQYGPWVTEEDPDTREIIRMWWQRAWDDLDNTAWKQLQQLYAAILGREIGRPKGRKPRKLAPERKAVSAGKARLMKAYEKKWKPLHHGNAVQAYWEVAKSFWENTRKMSMDRRRKVLSAFSQEVIKKEVEKIPLKEQHKILKWLSHL